jgi:cell pole-organizing protein PopZ
MQTSARYAQTALTDEHTADVAAGALGKLISKMEIAGDNTIEGLVKEMLKPMIKDWLDANLANIVEEKVEAEVQRIARMAR